MNLVKPDPPHRREVVFVVDLALFFVERRDRRHFLETQREVENVQVLRHALAPHGLRNHHDAPLIEPAKNHGGDGLSVRPGDFRENRVREDSLLSFGKGRPGFVDDSFGLEEFVRFLLLTEGMRFDLIDRGLHFVVKEQAVTLEVRYAALAAYLPLRTKRSSQIHQSEIQVWQPIFAQPS